jgi:hypothetical protein
MKHTTSLSRRQRLHSAAIGFGGLALADIVHAATNQFCTGVFTAVRPSMGGKRPAHPSPFSAGGDQGWAGRGSMAESRFGLGIRIAVAETRPSVALTQGLRVHLQTDDRRRAARSRASGSAGVKAAA